MIEMLPPPQSVTVTRDSGPRELTPEEIASVEHIFKERGASLPDSKISSFIGVVENGGVVAFIVLQLKLHAEPMYIEDGKSHLFLGLVSYAEQLILQRAGPQYVYLFAPAGRVSQLAQSMGMTLEPWNVLSKLVMPEVPEKGVVDLSVMPLSENPEGEVIH